MKILVVFLLSGVLSAQELPDTPQPQPETQETRMANFSQPWMSGNGRAGNNAFWIAHGIFILSGVTDAVLTQTGLHHGGCYEANPNLGRYPTGFALYAEDVGIPLALTGFDFLLKKGHIPIAPFIAPVYGSIVHFRGAAHWYTKGCL